MLGTVVNGPLVNPAPRAGAAAHSLPAMAGLHEELTTSVDRRYGWGVRVAGREWKLTSLQTPAGAHAFAGRFVPDPARRVATTALWMALGLAAVALAARRHRER